MSDVPVDRISEFEKGLLLYVDNNYPGIVEDIKVTKDLTDKNIENIKVAIEEFKKAF